MSTSIARYYYEPTKTHLELSDDGIIVARFGRATVSLEENTAESRWAKTTYEQILTKTPVRPLYILMDFSKIDNSEYNSDESNAIYLEMLRDSNIAKVAMFGLHSGWELFINLFSFYVKNKIKTFTTEIEARQWIDKIKHASVNQ